MEKAKEHRRAIEQQARLKADALKHKAQDLKTRVMAS